MSEDGRNITWHDHVVDRADRERMNGHRGVTVWLTGLSGSGKSTIDDILVRMLHEMGVRTAIPDGDNIRHGLNSDLGFSPEERKENIRRIGEVARKARSGEIPSFTGISAPYEHPLDPELHLRTHLQSAEESAITILDLLRGRGIVS